MKKLKRILLINWWYYSKQLIDVDDINFLTGRTGAGKSTIIDALQIVLLGETNAKNFNKAAGKSERTLDGYLRADVDPNNKYSRKGKDFSSYIACEFFDNIEGTRFVTGIVFDCRNDGSRQERYFVYSGAIPDNCFIENGQALDIRSLRAYLTQTYGTKATLCDTHKEYRDTMLAKWNVHNEQVLRMMKKAISFQPITDIQQFITENICDIPDKPNIEIMQQNIRDYKRHEQLAKRQEDKLVSLNDIADKYKTVVNLREQKQLHSFLVLWGRQEIYKLSVADYKHQAQEYGEKEEQATSQSKAAEKLAEQTDLERTQLIEICSKSDVYQEEKRLKEQRKFCQNETDSLKKTLEQDVLEIRRESERMTRFCTAVENSDSILWSDSLRSVVGNVHKAYAVLNEVGNRLFVDHGGVFDTAYAVTGELGQKVDESYFSIRQQKEELEQGKESTQESLAKLRKNIKDYPAGLLLLKSRLQTELEEKGHSKVEIAILADVLEIASAEERWRGAIEGYLNTQKFYLLVDPVHYEDALRIYDRIKRDFNRQSFGLVDIETLRKKETLNVHERSLAKKIETDNEWARSYVDYLLGRVVACDRVEDLRQYNIAITAEGMLYQGYVARPLRKAVMEDSFIGRRAVALRIQRLEEALTRIEKSLNEINPVYALLDKQRNMDVLLTERYVNTVVPQRQKDALRMKELENELVRINEALDSLDLVWLQEQQARIEELRKKLVFLHEEAKKYASEATGFKVEKAMILNQVLPQKNRELDDVVLQINTEFPEKYIETVGVPRYKEEVKRLRSIQELVTNYSASRDGRTTFLNRATSVLQAARTQYADTFKPCSFNTMAENNDEYEAERIALAESELPKYREKIQAARRSALEQFQNDFLSRLKSGIDQVRDQVKQLNKALKQAQFGTDSYQFCVERNPDYADYYDMIMADELMEGDVGLFSQPFQEKYSGVIERLFNQIAATDDFELNERQQSDLQKNIELFTDFRTYLKFDLETTDENGTKQMLSQTLHKKSGGETQTPFYIAMLASFAQLYQINNVSALASNTVRLVVFDEAFSKMDSERIIESVNLLRRMGLQAIVCAPEEKLPAIMPLADRTNLVVKEGYHMSVYPFTKEMNADVNSLQN